MRFFDYNTSFCYKVNFRSFICDLYIKERARFLEFCLYKVNRINILFGFRTSHLLILRYVSLL